MNDRNIIKLKFWPPSEEEGCSESSKPKKTNFKIIGRPFISCFGDIVLIGRDDFVKALEIKDSQCNELKDGTLVYYSLIDVDGRLFATNIEPVQKKRVPFE